MHDICDSTTVGRSGFTDYGFLQQVATVFSERVSRGRDLDSASETNGVGSVRSILRMSESPLTPTALRPWIEFTYARSPGPGGQNVNKVNTRATLLLDFTSCPLFSPDQRSVIRRTGRTRLSRDGRIRFVSRRERTQRRNRTVALDRLIVWLAESLVPKRVRRTTRVPFASRRRRLDEKKRRAETKRLRGSSEPS